MAIKLKDLKKELLKIANEAVKRETIKEVSDDIVKDMKRRTIDGTGITKEGNEVKLPELAAPTIKFRRALASAGKLTGPTNASLSNVTRTGRMVKSVTSKSFRGRAVFGFKSAAQEKKAQKLLSVRSRTKGLREFRWFGITKKKESETVKTLQDKVNSAIRKFNNK